MSKTLLYVFDPLCGWCYGAGATLTAAARNPAIRLRLMPSGMFAGGGARPTDDQFASHAWSNDQRIERLTGQAFSERYRTGVLADRGQWFDSGPATLALTTVALTAPQREPDALKAIQLARYVDGLNITRPDTLANVLRALGIEAAATRFTAPDAELLLANRARMDEAQALMKTFGARGVPTFILEDEGRRELLPASSVYSDPEAFVNQLAAA